MGGRAAGFSPACAGTRGLRSFVPSRWHRARGFTLLEALLSLTLTIMLLSGVFAFYATVLRARDEGGRASRDAKLSRAILQRIADDIRYAADFVPGDGVGFRGDRRWITVVRTNMTERYAFDEFDPMREQLPPAQLDIRRVKYELAWDEELKDDEGVAVCHGLLRREQKTFDPNPKLIIKDEQKPGEADQPEAAGAPQEEFELVAPEVKYIDFEYFDGADWRDRWQFTEEPAEGEAGAAAGGLGDLAGLGGLAGGAGADSAKGGFSLSKPQATDQRGYILPQAVRVTIGRTRIPPEDDKLDLSKLKDWKERRQEEQYHDDRFTVVVPIRQADQTLLRSRKYGVSDSLSRQEGGPR